MFVSMTLSNALGKIPRTNGMLTHVYCVCDRPHMIICMILHSFFQIKGLSGGLPYVLKASGLP